jgi:purine-nucleoside phosphorylase
MLDLFEKIGVAENAVRARWDASPRVGIILGTGLGGFAEEIDVEARVPYAEIPHFPEATVESHSGHLLCGRLRSVATLAMEGLPRAGHAGDGL